VSEELTSELMAAAIADRPEAERLLVEALLKGGASPGHEGAHSLGLALMLCPLEAQPTIQALLEKAEGAG